jgi:L-aspartate oxidase
MNEEMVLITQTMRELQGIMTNYVGIVRSNLRLRRAADRLSTLERETEELYKKSVLIDKICEVRNLIKVATLIVKMAIERKESRGLHFSIDYPKVSETETNAFSPEY